MLQYRQKLLKKTFLYRITFDICNRKINEMKKLITYKEALKITLAKTNEGLHFKGQFLTKENYFLLGKEVEIINLAFNYVYWIRYKNKEYFISEELISNKNT